MTYIDNGDLCRRRFENGGWSFYEQHLKAKFRPTENIRSCMHSVDLDVIVCIPPNIIFYKWRKFRLGFLHGNSKTQMFVFQSLRRCGRLPTNLAFLVSK